MEKKFYFAGDIAQMLNISKSTACKIIHSLNDELRANGYITIAGRVPISFFKKRFYAGTTSNSDGGREVRAG